MVTIRRNGLLSEKSYIHGKHVFSQYLSRVAIWVLLAFQEFSVFLFTNQSWNYEIANDGFNMAMTQTSLAQVEMITYKQLCDIQVYERHDEAAIFSYGILISNS